jgi:hypothetical protein
MQWIPSDEERWRKEPEALTLLFWQKILVTIGRALTRAFRWLEENPHERSRRIDLEVLWPAIKRATFEKVPEHFPGVTEDQLLELARESFIGFMASDLSWRIVADDWSAEQLGDFVRSRLV